MKVLITDMRHSSIEEERSVLEPAGVTIDTSRAALVNRRALEAAMAEGRVSFFGADVVWQEPLDYSDPGTASFLERRDVLITPHMAWYSEDSERELRRKAAEEVLRFLKGEQLRHPV
ncbi:MAG: hypothetical protein JXB06_03610 [Spirochaetales bacterium]|nr:hypothetical protein [Spirochaetales bacterium]